MLKGLPNAESRLFLFEADVYKPDSFGLAIEGCEIVFHMATPLLHNNQSSQYKNTSEAAVAAVKSIAESCIKSGTVKRLIYTASIVAASPLKHDGNGEYKDFMDETCWTPLNHSFAYPKDFLIDYAHSKTLSEKEVLKYNTENLQVVSLACGLVGGDAIQSNIPESVAVLIAQYLNDKNRYEVLRFLEELNGKLPILHLQDVTSAHIFSMENSEIKGRFLCASAFLKSSEIANFLEKFHQETKIEDGFIEDTKRDIKWGSSKLEEFGFEYKYGVEKILNDSVECIKRFL
ncbi:hypothetical protein M9H77_33154 [Catharanthus roseus]|uniref:Uncharacterized protein n=1 Tax=Catharanthus roseus TaxID=4058 RepID=A0ACB9ZHW3_CATRO|nr:hypothetical protein M9H77_33154 [Catharanthus roseus]